MPNAECRLALEVARSSSWARRPTQWPGLSPGSFEPPRGARHALMRRQDSSSHAMPRVAILAALRRRLVAVAPTPAGVRLVDARDWRDVAIHGCRGAKLAVLREEGHKVGVVSLRRLAVHLRVLVPAPILHIEDYARAAPAIRRLPAWRCRAGGSDEGITHGWMVGGAGCALLECRRSLGRSQARGPHTRCGRRACRPHPMCRPSPQ